MRHHFLQLSALAEQGDIEKIRTYLAGATSKIPNLTVPFCENQAADSVVGYYCALAGRAQIPFSAQIDLPARIPVDEIDMCLVLSNLLENALEASLRMESGRYIRVEVSCHFTHLLLIQVENAFAGTRRRQTASSAPPNARTMATASSLSAGLQKKTVETAASLTKLASSPHGLC